MSNACDGASFRRARSWMGEAIWKVVCGAGQKEKWDTRQRHNGSYKSSVGSDSGLWAVTIRCWMDALSGAAAALLYPHPPTSSLSLFFSVPPSLPPSFCFPLFLSRSFAARSTVRRLLKRISHDRPTVTFYRDFLRSIQVSLLPSIYVIACLLFRTAIN